MSKKYLGLALAISAASAAQAGNVTTSGEDLVIDTDSGIKVKVSDNSASFQLGGRIQWDYDATQSDDNGVDTTDFDVRRARLYAKGHFGDWAYKTQFNVAESDGADGGTADPRRRAAGQPRLSRLVGRASRARRARPTRPAPSARRRP